MSKRLTLSEQLINLQNRLAMEHETAINRVAVIEDLETQISTKDSLIALQEEELRQLRPLVQQLADAQKEAKQEKSNREYYSRDADTKQKELEDLHTVLDVIPGALPRKDPNDQYGRTYSATVRLTVFLANHGRTAG